jgi:hypothetical protein
LYIEVPLSTTQADLKDVLQWCPAAQDVFQGFLSMPLKTKCQERAARKYLCMITGLPHSLSSSSLPSNPIKHVGRQINAQLVKPTDLPLEPSTDAVNQIEMPRWPRSGDEIEILKKRYGDLWPVRIELAGRK